MDKKEIIEMIVNKINKESDLTWNEIKTKVGLPYSKETIRKMSPGIKFCYDFFMGEDLKNQSEEEEKIHKKWTKMKIEQTKNQDIRTYINRVCREDARFEKILEYAKTISETLNNEIPLKNNTEYTLNESENEGILILSDLHIGLETKNHWNVFNMDILLKRLEYLKNKTITYGKQNNITHLNILCIGDLVNGLLHTTTRIENQENVAEQTVYAAELLSRLIKDLSKYFIITIYYSVGNHGRITPNKSDSLDGENFEYFIKYITKLRCKDLNNVKFVDNELDKELIYFNCLGWRIAACHGDKFGNKKNIVQRITSMIKEVPDYVLLGHLHHNYLDTIGSSELIINGSLSGTDTYAKNLGLTSRASQNMLIINKDLGKICLYHIYLDKIE